MQLTPSQYQIATDPHRFRVVNCGRRFGKTTLAVDQMVGCAVFRQARIAYIAPTFQQARDIAWEQLKKVCAQAAVNVNESRLEIKLPNKLGGESLIILRGWESIETMRGQSFDQIVLDEVASMKNFWLNWQEVVRPTLTDRKGEAIFISTPKGFNHFYDLFNLQETDEDFKSFHFTTYDNPHIPVEEVEKARTQLTEDRFSQEYLADFRKMEGLVYKEFNRERDVFDPQALNQKDFVEIIVGVDYGYTNPSAVLTIKRDSTDCFYVTDEFYERGKTDDEINEYVAGLNANRVYPDPAAAQAIADLKKRIRTVREVVKGKDSIKNGIDRVRELFKAGKLKISATCVNTLQELETYAYPDKKPDHNEYEDPIKENDHAMDALRYAIMMVNSRKNEPAPVYKPNYTPKPSPAAIAMGSPGMPQEQKPQNGLAHVYKPSYNKVRVV